MVDETKSPRARAFIFDGKQRLTITIAGLSLLVAGAIGAHAFLATHTSNYFIRSADAQEQHANMAQQIKSVGDAAKSAADAAQQAIIELRAHVAGEELNEARNKIDRLRTELSDTGLWESSNGANALSRARRLELENALERTIAHVNCLEQQRPNCQP